LGHFRAFERATGDETWDAVVSACHDVVAEIQETFSPETGLLPDFVMTASKTDHTPRPADRDFLDGPTDSSYSYNAGRVPWRLGVDALLNGDEVTVEQLRTISTWIEDSTNGTPSEVKAGYELDGTPLPDSDYFTTFFAAPFAVAAMTNPDQQAWLDDLYEAVRASDEAYYENTVSLLCLLALTGTFWDPTQPVDG
jgi:endoglucanase